MIGRPDHGRHYFEAFIAPSRAARAPEVFRSFPAGGGREGFLPGVIASGALFGLGFLAFAFAMFRARNMPRWAMALAAAGGPPVAVNVLLPHLVALSLCSRSPWACLGLSPRSGRASNAPSAALWMPLPLQRRERHQGATVSGMEQEAL